MTRTVRIQGHQDPLNRLGELQAAYLSAAAQIEQQITCGASGHNAVIQRGDEPAGGAVDNSDQTRSESCIIPWMDSIPPLRSPDQTPPIRTAADLYRHWYSMMGPLGFADRSLWILLLEPDGRPLPVLSRMEQLPGLPQRRPLRNLITTMERVVAEQIGDCGRIAMLLSRPGHSQLTTSDQAWAEGLGREVARSTLSLMPFYIATDEAIVPFDLPLAA